MMREEAHAAEHNQHGRGGAMDSRSGETGIQVYVAHASASSHINARKQSACLSTDAGPPRPPLRTTMVSVLGETSLSHARPCMTLRSCPSSRAAMSLIAVRWGAGRRVSLRGEQPVGGRPLWGVDAGHLQLQRAHAPSPGPGARYRSTNYIPEHQGQLPRAASICCSSRTPATDAHRLFPSTALLQVSSSCLVRKFGPDPSARISGNQH